MSTKSLLLLTVMLTATSPAVADLVTIEADGYTIVLNVELAMNDTQELEEGSLTYPLVVRGSEWLEAVASAMNFTSQRFTVGSASESVSDVPHDILTLDSNVGIQLDTYSEPPDGGPNTTPLGLGGEVKNLTISVVKNVTVGWINPIQTPMYRAEWNYGDGSDLPDVYFVLFAVDDVTTCRMESVSGVSSEMSADEFEEFLKNVDVLLNVRSSGGDPSTKNEASGGFFRV